MTKYSSLSLIGGVLLCFFSYCAEPSDSTFKPNASNTFSFNPRIGLGIGMLSFFGDVGNNYNHHPTVSSIGYDLSISSRVLNNFDVNCNVLLGTMSASERSNNRNLNFQSDVSAVGFGVSYDFGHLFKKQPRVNPFISLGIEAFEFKSKADLYDAEGNMYHYWSDGSIRNSEETESNLATAKIIQRDYVYESDLRNLDLDGFGKYQERNVAIPIGIGANMILGKGFSCQLSTNLHYTFTDLLDNVTAESIGDRKGDNLTDRFLFTKVALSYSIGGKDDKFSDPSELDWQDLFLKDTIDSDLDGVPDLADKCANTSDSIRPVDENGCPEDLDKDGVPDLFDNELETPPFSRVSNSGIAWTDDLYMQDYLRWMDSTGEYNNDTDYEIERNSIKSSDLPYYNLRPRPARNKEELIVVLDGQQTGVEANDLSKYLHFKRFKSIQKGDSTFFVLGDIENRNEAYALLDQVKDLGYSGAQIVKASTKNGRTKLKRVKQPNNFVAPKDLPPLSKGMVYWVQIGAFTKTISHAVFSDVPGLVSLKGNDGFTRYLSGSFVDGKEAINRMLELRNAGYEKSFIRVFKDGAATTLAEGGFNVPEGVEDDPNHGDESIDGAIDKSMVSFTVLVGEFTATIPLDILDIFLEIGGIEPVTNSQTNKVQYVSGKYNNIYEAEEQMHLFQREGIENAYIVGLFKGKVISVNEAEGLLGQ